MLGWLDDSVVKACEGPNQLGFISRTHTKERTHSCKLPSDLFMLTPAHWQIKFFEKRLEQNSLMLPEAFLEKTSSLYFC